MIKVTNNSVRDHAQQVTIRGHLVTVTSKVGRKSIGRYDFPLSAWVDLARQIGNVNWHKSEFVRRYTTDLDSQPGGPDQADRIRDAQMYAIDKAVTLAVAELA